MIKKVSVMEENWDYLIILDACRYDYFSELISDYFCGDLKKRVSLGSSTLEWCKKSFRKRYNDTVYISANPFINSKISVKGFDAKNHFHRVVDLWDWGWNKELGTVHPKEVNRAVRNFRDYYPDKRFLIHYLQPHSPYLSLQKDTPGFHKPQINRGYFLNNIMLDRAPSFSEKILLKAVDLLAKITSPRGLGLFGKNPRWKLRELLNLPPASPMEAVQRRVGENGLQQAYKENLKLVLNYVAKLVQDLSGVIIISADHGERLGEGGAYNHYSGLSDKSLIEIPWFEVKEAKECVRMNPLRFEEPTEKTREDKLYSEEDIKKIKKRLEKLGYI